MRSSLRLDALAGPGVFVRPPSVRLQGRRIRWLCFMQDLSGCLVTDWISCPLVVREARRNTMKWMRGRLGVWEWRVKFRGYFVLTPRSHHVFCEGNVHMVGVNVHAKS